MARLLLGVSGGIAAYKALETARLAVKAGHAVRVIQTATSERFVGRASFAAITGAPVLGGEFEPDAKLPPILGHYGELDDDPSPAMVKELEQNLRGAGHAPEFHSYPGARHWFAEPSRPQYDPTAAALAWDRTLHFLKKQLG